MVVERHSWLSYGIITTTDLSYAGVGHSSSFPHRPANFDSKDGIKIPLSIRESSKF